MSASAVDHLDVRWRVTGTASWSKAASIAPHDQIWVEGLEREQSYDFEVRAVAACGAASVWVPGSMTVPAAPDGTVRVDDLANPNANALPNPAFALGAKYWTLGAHWSVTSANGSPYANYSYQATAETTAVISDWIPCAAAADITVGADVHMGAVSAGVMVGDVEFASSGKTHLAYSSPFLSNLAAETAAGTRIAKYLGASPAGTAYCRVRVYSQNASGAGQFHVTRIKLEYSDHATPYSDEATDDGNQLTVAGSGVTVGNQGNLPPINWANLGSLQSVQPISYSVTAGVPFGADVNFTASAFSLKAGSVTLNYSASSLTLHYIASQYGQKTFYLYYRDAAATGGSLPLQATTVLNDLVGYDDVVYLGTCTVQVSASPAGGGGTGGGGQYPYF